jgi:hypothetical protein
MPNNPEKPEKAGAQEETARKIPGGSATPSKQPAQPKTIASDQTQATSQKPPVYLWIVGIGVLVIFFSALVWWIGGLKRQNQSFGSALAAAMGSSGNPGPRNSAPPIAPGVIATTDELSQPWSAKRFLFANSAGKKSPALVVRLPDDSYWAISMLEPYGSCELEYVTDMNELRTKYNFSATHPMVGDPCTHTVFDLEQYGSGPSGEVRGEIVAGPGVRPPLAIEVQVSGTKIVATQSEADIMH